MGFVVNKEKTDSRLAEVSRDLLGHVAALYYREGLMQSDIAKRLNISRASVTNYLRMARDHGIVDIRIEGRSFATSNISGELKKKFDLVDVYVAQDSNEEKTDLTTDHSVALTGAMAVYDLVSEQTRIGVAGGSILLELSRQIPRGYLPEASVYTLLGSALERVDSAAEYCAMTLAARLNATYCALHSPAVLSSKSLRDTLINEPVLRNELLELNNIDVAVFSVEPLDSNAHCVISGTISEARLKAYKDAGAVGVVAGRFFDENGVQVELEDDHRFIGMDIAQLSKLPIRVLIASGTQSLIAVKAALKGQLCTHLAIDRATGDAISNEVLSS